MTLYKLLFTFLISLISLFTSIISHAGEGTPFNQIVFFGDSLSDNGNLYSRDFWILPKSPPYFAGQFSNGPVWSEEVAAYYQQRNVTTSTNYAIGGETSIFHNPVNGFLPYSLTMSLNSYLIHTFYRDRSHTLFIIWIGANDYLKGSDAIDQLTTAVIDNIKATIESLIYHGGMNFLVINLPDLSRTPYSDEQSMTSVLNALTLAHNAKLKNAIADIANNYKQVNIHLYDINQMFHSLITTPDVFNQKYNIHLVDVKNACWQGGYTQRAKKQEVTLESLAMQINKQAAIANSKKAVTEKVNAIGLAQYVIETPALLESYQTSVLAEEDKMACVDPDAYVFWDHLHPTSVVHKILSKDMIDYINQYYSLA